MRLGNSIFYNIESSRQEYLGSLETHQLLTAFATLGFFIGYAIRTPMHSKLYKELAKSLALGAGVTYSYPAYYRYKYHSIVEDSYEIVRQKFEANPKLLDKLD